jgi:hypothetical protein
MIGGQPAADVLREMRSGGFGTPVAATGSMGDFIGGVKALTAAGGRNLSRKAAVEELNQQRMQAGMPALDTESVLNEMLQQDREPLKVAAVARQARKEQQRKVDELNTFLDRKQSLLPEGARVLRYNPLLRWQSPTAPR